MLDDQATGHFLSQMIQFASEWVCGDVKHSTEHVRDSAWDENAGSGLLLLFDYRCCSFIFQSVFVAVSWACPVQKIKEGKIKATLSNSTH